MWLTAVMDTGTPLQKRVARSAACCPGARVPPRLWPHVHPSPPLSPSPPTHPHPQTGIWSQVKRAPKANRKRKTFEVAGPSAAGAMPMDERARQIFQYFKSYNYKVGAVKGRTASVYSTRASCPARKLYVGAITYGSCMVDARPSTSRSLGTAERWSRSLHQVLPTHAPLASCLNLQVKETGEVIVFEGIYAADRGQAAAVTFYTFCGGLARGWYGSPKTMGF